ncbi:hypothetical protein POKO110462_07500 [Pontibacter korlensis]|uniref:hypothetical protein n=1 Tax=Pontibacter korlensis TaxID=400092 RepID=UPI000697EB72|nr:hypothetical protein [Pontibacter korlensis]
MKYTLVKALWVLMAVVMLSSCVISRKKTDKNGKVIVITNGSRKDNGLHKGWYKNPNNPHHPRTTNPGHTKHKGKGTVVAKGQHGKGKKGKH